MLIQITNRCLAGCVHCLNNSGDNSDHMDINTWNASLRHAMHLMIEALIVSGGEPTEHPDWYAMLDQACAYKFDEVVMATNGMWIGTEKEEKVVSLLKKYPYFKLQITSVKGLYVHHDEMVKKIDRFAEDMRAKNLNKQVFPCIDVTVHMCSLGRAAKNDECLKQAAEDTSCTTSCLQGVLVSAQIPYRHAIYLLEDQGKFCRPRINHKGEISWSESCLCPGFASVFDDMLDIDRKSKAWRPCGACPDYKKLLTKPGPQYDQARRVLGIKGKEST